MGVERHIGGAFRSIGPGGALLDPLRRALRTGDASSRAARRAEEARQAQIASATGEINRIFDSPERQAQYADYLDALRGLYGQDIGRQRTDADRATKFGLARAGVIGGSQDVDARRTLAERFGQMLLEAERRAQGAERDLRGQDEQQRLDLIGMAQQGGSLTDAARRSAEALRNVGTDFRPEALGDIFGDLTQAYTLQRQQQGRARARREDIYAWRG